MRITLLRHGKPNCDRNKWLRFSQFKQWIEAYKNVDLDESFIFPSSFETLTSINKAVFSSDLPRSIQTAKGLSPVLVSNSIFREVDFSLPKIFLPIRLRPMMWMTLCRIIWILGFHCQVESVYNTKERAQRAADLLIYNALKKMDVILVGHGFFNLFIATELRKKGWKGPLIPNFGFSKGSSYFPYLLGSQSVDQTNNSTEYKVN
ncbi:MAG: histidine phosphatase family protein [Deltaproteobacteria bacterium]|nr:histidine phosphatase family protein [Deltaproteobacteria bacterium]